MTRDMKIRAEEQFPITGQGFASGKLLDSTECQILLDMGEQSPTCLNLTICDAKLYMHYQNFLLTLRKFR